MATTTNTRRSVHVNFNYSIKSKEGFTIFHNETLVFHHYDSEEDEAALKWLKRMMSKTREYALYVLRLDKNDGDKNGLLDWDVVNCKMFQRSILEDPSVTKTSRWSGSRYDVDEQYVDNKTAFNQLREEIELQKNWRDFE